MIKKTRLRWFRHVEHKDDIDRVKRCIMLEIEGIREDALRRFCEIVSWMTCEV